MKVLHLSSGSLSSGAARGALWLHHALKRKQISSSVLTNSRIRHAEEGVSTISDNSLAYLFNARLPLFADRLLLKPFSSRRNTLFSTGVFSSFLPSSRFFNQFDIIHLHWINGYISLPFIRNIKKPIVWTLRDMWPFTGGCHYSMECTKFKDSCSSCPQLNSFLDFDPSGLLLHFKQISYQHNIHFVGISSWISSLFKSSAVGSYHSIRTIPNAIPCSLFKPIPKDVARESLGLPSNLPIILLGANNLLDYYKGFDLFLESLLHINFPFNLVTFGCKFDPNLFSINRNLYQLGYLSSFATLSLAYSAADLFVMPSRMEAFGKTCAEAISCGTPLSLSLILVHQTLLTIRTQVI